MVNRVPNCLTCLRLALIPVMVLLLVDPSKLMLYLALFVFLTAAFTDYADGLIARKYKVVSNFGKLIDPLADKILVMAALVMLASLRIPSSAEPFVPGWLVVLVLAREFWITGLRGFAASKGVVMAASAAGKWKSALQMAAISFLFLHDLSFFRTSISCKQLGFVLLLVSVFISYWGAISYTRGVFGAAKT